MDKKLFEIKSRILDYMINVYNVDLSIKHIKENCMDEYKEKLKVANLLLDNIFLFDETWDMEACRIPYKNKQIDWKFTPNGDEEWTFMLARHEYLDSLIISYYINNNEKYIEKAKELINNWIDNNNLDDDIIITKRAIDTGIRCSSWLNVIIHLVNLNKISEDELKKYIESIYVQLKYMKRIYKEKYTLSNWGVLQTVSILNNCRWFKEIINDEELELWAEKELLRQSMMQVFDDGSHWEQSPMYHVEVLKCFNSYIWNSKILKYKINDYIIRTTDKMSEYIMYTRTPKGYFEAQCDSDRSFVKDILEAGVVISKNRKIKRILRDEKISLSTIYSYGYLGVNTYEEVKEEKGFEKSKSFIDSGNIYIRNNFTEKSNFTVLKNGTIGSGHGHSDLGHISLYYKGEPFLIDSGRYTYVEEDKVREYFKSAYAHNVSIIDNKPACVSKGSWDSSYYSECFKNYYKHKNNIHYSELSYLSNYEEENCIVLKKIIYIEVGIWFIITDIRYKGNHLVKNYYNFDSDVDIIKGELNSIQAINKKKLDFNFYNIDDVKIKSSIISKKYNELSNSNKVITTKEFKDYIVTSDMILESKSYISIENINIRRCDGNKEEDVNRYVGKRIQISVNESYTIIIFNSETYTGKKMYYINDEPFYGKVIVMHNLNGKIKTSVLRG